MNIQLRMYHLANNQIYLEDFVSGIRFFVLLQIEESAK